MWRASFAPLEDAGGIRACLWNGADPVSFSATIEAWAHDPSFRRFTCAILADLPYAAFRWETPPWCVDTARQPFEFVAIDCPELDRAADPAAFAPHFARPDAGSIMEITNLGGDARLFVPRPIGPPVSCSHLGAFVRGAPQDQQQALWRCVGARLQACTGADPVWLSTAGLGVPWLHVRIDRRPKYYAHAPYRTLENSAGR